MVTQVTQVTQMEAAFSPSAFVSAIEPMVRDCVGRLGLQRAEADDLVQDVCLQVFRAARRRGEAVFDKRSRITTWVYAVVANAERMRRRRAARRRGRESQFIKPEDLEVEDPAPRADASIDRIRLERRIAETVQRVVDERAVNGEERDLFFRAIRGERLTDLAREAGVSDEAMKSRLFRIRRTIKRLTIESEAGLDFAEDEAMEEAEEVA